MDQSIERLLMKTSQHSGDSMYDGCGSYASSTSSTPDPGVFYNDAPAQPLPVVQQQPPAMHFVPGTVAYRTRHLSCILENWSENESYSSLPNETTAEPIDDDPFVSKPMSWEAEDLDEYITTLDESCILDIESLERIDRIADESNMSTWPRQRRAIRVPVEMHTVPDMDGSGELVTGHPVEQYPNIMTESCYGALADDPFDAKPDEGTPEPDVLEQLTQMLRNTEVLVNRQQKEIEQEQRIAEEQQQEQQEQQQTQATNEQPDYLILNPPLLLNQPKCRSPLPMSLNSSYCEATGTGTTSMNNSFYEMRSMQTSIDFGQSGGAAGAANSIGGIGLLNRSFSSGVTTVNPLDMSFASQDGNEETVELMVDNDLQAIRKLLENETGGAMCPSCQMPFDKGKKRKLIDNCGHERCYSCMFKNEACPVCRDAPTTDEQNNDLLSCGDPVKLQDYDTGIGGSTTTISPLGSPQPFYRGVGSTTVNGNGAAATAKAALAAKTNGYYMQSRSALTSPTPSSDPESSGIPPPNPSVASSALHRFLPMKPPPAQSSSGTHRHVVADVTVHSSATPPANRRRLFNPKNLRSPFGQRRPVVASAASTSSVSNAATSSSSGGYTENASTLSGNDSSMETSAHSDSSPLTASIGSTESNGHRNISNTGSPSSSSNGTGVSRLLRAKRGHIEHTIHKAHHRLSLGSHTAQAYAGQLSTMVFGKIRSLWNAQDGSAMGLNQLASMTTTSAATTDDEGGNVKPVPIAGKSKSSHDELQLRLGFFLQNNAQRRNVRTSAPAQSCSSLASANTSPVSTLTGSSEADVSRVLHPDTGHHLHSHLHHGTGTYSDSIGSMMSVSMSGNSNGSSSPISRRHSVTTAQQGPIEELGLFKTRKAHIRRSARSAPLKSNGDEQRARFARAAQAQAVQQPIAQLTLRPLFFEVPQQEPDPVYVGRDWLLQELSQTIAGTATPGILIDGFIGTGKTALILQLVEHSCFGRRATSESLKSQTSSPVPSDYDSIVSASSAPPPPPPSTYERIRTLASHVVAYHFCQADNNMTCLVPDFIHSLAAQLCQAPQLANYRDHILSEPHLQNILSVRECVADPERAMKMGILEPLAILKRTGKLQSARNCLILVDALCEAEYHRPDHGDTIGTFLARMSEHFPAWLRVIATVRTPLLELVKRLAYTRLSLNHWAGSETTGSCASTPVVVAGPPKDIGDYITFRVGHSPSIQANSNPPDARGHCAKDAALGQLKFMQYLLGIARGSFLFAKLSLDLIERGYLVIKSTSYNVLPVSLAEIYLLHFNLRFPTASAYEKVEPILNVCLAALYPLTISEIYYAVCALTADEPALEWDEFQFRFKQLSGFLVQRRDDTYMFFHPSFREWLMRRDESDSSKFLCDLRSGHAAIAFKLSRIEQPLDAEQALEMGHHILKAHVYRQATVGGQTPTPRDLQSYWLASVTRCVSSALCTLRNVYSPNLKVSRLLLLAGASPDHVTAFLGRAPILCIAAHEGNVPMVRLLLEFGADVEATNSQGCTALILAAAGGHCDVVRQLVAAGAVLGHGDVARRCALVHAARMNKPSIVKYLAACDWMERESTPEDVRRADASQQALIAAATQGNAGIVEDVLDMEEVCIDGACSLTGETALTAAARNGCTETVSVLVARGATVDRMNRRALTALLLAVREGHWAVAERLLQSQADAELMDGAGKTALIVAAEEGHVGIIELLVNRGASLGAQDLEGLSALSWSCLRGRLQAAKCLAERGADVHHVDNTGRTPLDLAAYQGSSALVQMLLDKGVRIEHVDVNGMRPLDRAIACRNMQVVQVFLKRGAKLGPATWTMAAGKPEIMLLLLNKLLEDGNILYRKNRLQDAAHRYQYALRKIPAHSSFAEHAGTFLQLKVNFLLNHSRCKRKMNEFAEAVDLAAQSIELRPDNYEGYYARSKAYMELNRTDEALFDARMAIERCSGASGDIQKILLRLQDDLQQRCAEQDAHADSVDTTDL